MKTIKNLLSTATRFFKIPTPGLKGFTLIELLVVIGIIGVLAAVAIPAFQTYRETASRNALTFSLKSIAKSHTVCRVKPDMSSLDDCDTLSELDITCEKCGMMKTNSGDYDICVHADDGENKACLQIDSARSGGNIFPSWEKSLCNTLKATYKCTSSNFVAPNPDPCAGCSVSATIPTGSCSGDSTIACTNTADSTDRSSADWDGECQTSGKCK